MIAAKNLSMNEGKGSMTTGQRIKQVLGERGVSQKDLADHLGVSPGTISNWCRDKSGPDDQEIELIAEMLEVNRAWLTNGEGLKYPWDSADGVAYSMNHKIVGDLLHDLILGRLGMDFDEAAAKMGVDVEELSQCIGLAPAPSWGLLKKLHGALGVSIHFLLTGEGQDILPDNELDRLILALGVNGDRGLANALGVDYKEVVEIRKRKWVLPAAWTTIMMERFGVNPAWIASGKYPSHLAKDRQSAPMAAETALDYKEKYLDTREQLQDIKAEMLRIQEQITRAVANVCAQKGVTPDLVGALNSAIIDYPSWQTAAQARENVALYEAEPGGDKSHQKAAGE